MKELYSFDIFDTCLGRICGNPQNLFDVMAITVIGPSASVTEINDFVLTRKQAEKEARKLSNGKEITIYDIYHNADFSPFTNLSTEDLIKLEMDLEEKNLYPIRSSLNKISQIHKNGGNVVFISDMYLPLDFLKELLLKNGFWNTGDKLYVSSDVGHTKSSGLLYDYVRSIERPSLGLWHHYGDNFWSDNITAIKKGIIPHHKKNCYTPYELFINRINIKVGWNISPIVAGISQSIIRENENNIKVRFASDLIAPIYVPFVYNILKSANEKGIKKLFFLSRDGYIFLKIAEQFKNLFPNLELVYLYASRKSLYLPGITEINRDSLQSILINSNKGNIKEVLDNLQIVLSDKEYDDIINSHDVVSFILSSKEIMTRIYNKWKEQKECCIKYFIQEGLADNNSANAIVDLRGSRKSQICINKILNENGYNSVSAYYLEVTSQRVLLDKDNKYEAIYFMDTIRMNPLMKGLYEGKYLLEHYFSVTPFKRCSGYLQKNEIIVPVYDENEYVSCSAEESCIINQKICEQFAQRMVLLGVCDYSIQIMELGLAALSSFLINPNRSYLKALLNIDMSQTQYKRRVLVKYLMPGDFICKKVAWHKGALKLTFGMLGPVIFKLMDKSCKIINHLM